MGLEINFHNEREFRRWLSTIGHERARLVTLAMERAADLGGSWAGEPLVRYLGGRLYEVRRRGDRIYFQQSTHHMTVLAVGAKDTQSRDIERARRRMV